MNEKDAITYLLSKEIDFLNKMNHAITEILRLGINSERGKDIISNTIDSIEYMLEEMKGFQKRFQSQ